MSQEVLYRKWRPGTFGDVAGQDPIMTTLRHAVAAASPAHAYLFTGPRGTGKTSTGRILAKAVNCTAPLDGEPCNLCDSCRAFSEGRALDLIELDAASNRGIDEVRALREGVGYSPNAATYKVYLVDEVHMLTDAAFNALLKTLEEPPPHVIFVLATTEPHRIPPTISSRCQRFDFRRIALPDIVQRLNAIAAGEGIAVADGGMELIARQAGGSLRDAVNLLDQLAAFRGTTLDLDGVQRGLGLVVDDRAPQLARAAIERDLAAGLGLLSAVRDDGIEVRAFVREVVSMLRTLLLLRAGAREGLALSDGQLAELTQI
ncbi:MAG: DNA polymerase III subunit gamma/tau, partial [Chloroflexi bacterium]|nr:DNA polymerase III subunit gamma/tau [Chloroflexota bacterium]